MRDTKQIRFHQGKGFDVHQIARFWLNVGKGTTRWFKPETRCLPLLGIGHPPLCGTPGEYTPVCVHWEAVWTSAGRRLARSARKGRVELLKGCHHHNHMSKK
eukprot:scaffold474_cov169-Ochromonas_danica.AAC.29